MLPAFMAWLHPNAILESQGTPVSLLSVFIFMGKKQVDVKDTDVSGCQR